jgi:outer membrane protein assembly factor BamD
MKKPFILSIAIVLVLSACQSVQQPDLTLGKSAEELYEEAKRQLDSNNYTQAVKQYEALLSRYPYGSYSQQAQFDMAFAYFREQEGPKALSAIDHFIRQYPNHPRLDYLYYLRALTLLDQRSKFFGDLTKLNLSDKDPQALLEAFDTYKTLVEKYPKSDYAPVAQEQLQKLAKAISEYELNAARFYMKRQAYLAAANRAQDLILKDPQSPGLEEALAIMSKAYKAMGQQKLYEDTQRIISTNFPASIYLQHEWSPPQKKWWVFW